MAGLLDLFPILRKLPSLLLPIKKEGQEMHRRELKLFKEYYNGVKQGLQNGTAKVRPHAFHVPSFGRGEIRSLPS